MDKQIDILLSKVDIEDVSSFYATAKEYLEKEEKKCVITANPEIVMTAINHKKLKEFFMAETTIIIPDGIGVVSVLRKKYKNKKIKRNTGIEFVLFLLNYANEANLRVCVYGAKQNVLKDFMDKCENKYPNISFVKCFNGYEYSADYVEREFVTVNADIILVALGTPKQELFLQSIFPKLKKGICVGIGGSLDVLSGNKKRAPELFIRCNLEWLYRIMTEPWRIKRFLKSNMRFMIKTLF